MNETIRRNLTVALSQMEMEADAFRQSAARATSEYGRVYSTERAEVCEAEVRRLRAELDAHIG